MTLRPAALLFLALAVPGAASAQAISATNPEGVAEAIRSLGYSAQVGTDARGEPQIDSAMAGVNYSIYFYGCEGGRDCRWMQFSAGFDLAQPLTISSANDWNRRYLFGEATIDDDGDAYITYFFTTEGGISKTQFNDLMIWWETALGQFQDHINW